METKVKALYETYPLPNEDFKSLKDLEKHKWIIQPLKKLNKNSNILMVGCGTGEHALLLSQYVHNIHGIDFSSPSIRIANENRKKFKIKNVEFEVDDITIEKERGKYDYVMSIGVLHHIPDIDKALQNIKKTMKEDSLAIFSVNNKYSCYFQNRKKKDIHYRNFLKIRVNEAMYQDHINNPYWKMYSYKEFKNILERNGFEIVDYWIKIPEWFRFISQKNKMMNYLVKIK